MTWKQPPVMVTTLRAKRNASKLRRSVTDAEKILWKHLRGDFVGQGTHFRRQVAIGAYIADFCCLGHRLVVEVDGPIHDTGGAATYDRQRDDWLRREGFTILRFANADVMLDINSVLGRVRAALAGLTPTPIPSPQGGGERAHMSGVHPAGTP